jgi:hypothetical protein
MISPTPNQNADLYRGITTVFTPKPAKSSPTKKNGMTNPNNHKQDAPCTPFLEYRGRYGT